MNSLEQSVNGLRLSGMSARLVDRTRRVLRSVSLGLPSFYRAVSLACPPLRSGTIWPSRRDVNSGSRDRLWRNVPEVVLLVPRKRSVRHFPRIADGLRGRPQTVVALRVSVAYHGLYVIPIRRRRGLYARKKTGKVRAPGLQLPGCQEQQVLWYVL